MCALGWCWAVLPLLASPSWHTSQSWMRGGCTRTFLLAFLSSSIRIARSAAALHVACANTAPPPPCPPALRMCSRFMRPPSWLTCLFFCPHLQATLLLRDIWRGQSARAAQPPNDRALRRDVTNLTLTRWDPAKPASLDNLVLLTFEEADRHEKLEGLEVRRDGQVWVVMCGWD
jgi:hypothetical protein